MTDAMTPLFVTVRTGDGEVRVMGWSEWLTQSRGDRPGGVAAALRRELADGPRDAIEVRERLQGKWSRDTIRDAKRRVGVLAFQDTARRWMWRLPDEDDGQA